jgi:PAS domain S-box-containing protein
MTGTYNLALVALSYLVTTLAAYVALNLASRMYLARGRVATYWLVGGALAMGTGIWSMHFIGMLAFQLPVPTSYDIAIALLSLLIAVLVSGFALFTIDRGELTGRRLIASGVLMGAGIAGTHYTGMASLRMYPPISYDLPLLTLSLVIAVAASIAALWLVFRLRSASVTHVVQKRIASALVMGLAIAGMHYTGMAAATFDAGSVSRVGPQQVSTVWLATTIACCTVLLLAGTMLLGGGERTPSTDVARPLGIRFKIGLVFLVILTMVSGFVGVSLLLLVDAAEVSATREAKDVAMSIARLTPDSPIDNPARSQRIVDRFHQYSARDIFFVDTRKYSIADAESGDVGKLYTGDSDNAVGKTLADGRARTFVEVRPGAGGLSRQYVSALHKNPLDATSPIVGAMVLEYTQIYDAYQASARSVAYLIAVIGLAVVFVTSILGLRVVANIAPRLVALKRGADTLASGNYNVRVPISTMDEIGALANAFNRMAEDLEASHAELLLHQHELESRVVARTADLQRVEEAQRQLASELRLVTEHVPVGLCYLDRDLRYHHHNRRYAVLAGLVDEKIDGHLLVETLAPELYALIKAPIAGALAGRQVVYERAKVAGNEQSGSVQSTLVPRMDSEGRVVGLYAMLQDTSERTRAEDALRRSNEKLKAINLQLRDAQSQLLQAAKMASIGQLASGVAHEINNPIGYVFSNLGTLEHYLGDMFTLLDRYAAACDAISDATTRANLRAAHASADVDFVRGDVLSLLGESKEGITRVKRIVADLKNFSRSAGDEAWQWADLHLGIDSTLNIVMNEIKYKADIRKQYGALPQVQCRLSQLNQVFLNMLVNSADAIKDRGIITIRSGVADTQVWVEFEDTGSGIAAEDLDRIFDPFFTTKPVGKGTGLGLAVSYGIVTEHGGRIDVASEVGKGTVFRIWLPIRQATGTTMVGPDDASPDATRPTVSAAH